MTATAKNGPTTADDTVDPESATEPMATSEDASPEVDLPLATVLTPRQQAFALRQAELVAATDGAAGDDGDDDLTGTIDYAISGPAGIGESRRPGLAAMLARIERGGIDQVLAESTDRITRHEGDSFAIRERLAFVGVRLFTLTDGEITHLTGTIKGLRRASPTPIAWRTALMPTVAPSEGCARSTRTRRWS